MSVSDPCRNGSVGAFTSLTVANHDGPNVEATELQWM